MLDNRTGPPHPQPAPQGPGPDTIGVPSPHGLSDRIAMAPVLVTGAAGFIGFHLARRYLNEGREVVGLDNVNGYYDPTLKEARLDVLRPSSGFTFARLDLTDREGLQDLFARHRFKTVVHLAAQAGVRYSLDNPHAYTSSNVEGFVTMLECCRRHGVEHLLYASSSSVYGAVTAMPFSVHQNVDHPLSLYAATKKANELMAHCYSHLYGLPTTGLRFFTVYGPWGRPDMALFLFTKSILGGEPIQVFNNGDMQRDFTYVDDVVDGVRRLADRVAQPNRDWSGQHPDPGTSAAPYRLHNIGNSSPVKLMRLIEALERKLGVEARKVMRPMQPGDVPATYADVSDLEEEVGFRPSTSIEEGVGRFVDWYRDYYRV